MGSAGQIDARFRSACLACSTCRAARPTRKTSENVAASHGLVGVPQVTKIVLPLGSWPTGKFIVNELDVAGAAFDSVMFARTAPTDERTFTSSAAINCGLYATSNREATPLSTARTVSSPRDTAVLSRCTSVASVGPSSSRDVATTPCVAQILLARSCKLLPKPGELASTIRPIE